MKLIELELKDFKGIHELRIDFGGRSMNLYGGNGTGKTTVYDAFLWLLFDRDSSNRYEFAIKPRRENGQEIHHLQTWVRGCILYGEKKITLKKSLAEKWTKKRGKDCRTFTGHEIVYSVDGTPCTKGEYQGAVAGLMDEKTFRMVTDPAYFNSAATWQERREMLFRLAGYSKQEDEAVARMPAFSSIREALMGKTADELKKSLIYSKKNRRKRYRIFLFVWMRSSAICPAGRDGMNWRRCGNTRRTG